MSSAVELSHGVRRHLRFGWWALLLFLSLGLTLEAFHGFKIDWYLSVAHETRRLLWRLAHAHGALLALVNLLFAATLPALDGFTAGARDLASKSLLAASVLMPAGFFLAGFGVVGGDPGLSIVLVIPGGLALFLAVLLSARAATAGEVESKKSSGRKR